MRNVANCPQCGKAFEAHVVVGRQEGLRVGDVAMCIGCATPLVLEAFPYEFRKMTAKELSSLDLDTKLTLARAKAKILETKGTASDLAQHDR